MSAIQKGPFEIMQGRQEDAQRTPAYTVIGQSRNFKILPHLLPASTHGADNLLVS